MFKVKISNARELGVFLSVNDNEYVDAFFYGEKLRLVSNSTELFACLILDAEVSEGQQDFSCRINTKLLKSIDADNQIVVTDLGDDVQINFFSANDVLYYKSVFTKQLVFDTTYSDKLKLLGRGNVNLCDSDSFVELGKIAKMFHSFVCIDAGTASVILTSGPRIYKKVETKDTFALTGEAIDGLRKCNHLFANVGSSILAEKGNLSVIARKVVAGDNSEYSLLSSKQFGAKCIAELDLTRLVVFFKKTHIKLESVSVNASEKCVKVNGFNSEFTIPIFIKITAITEGSSISNFSIPAPVLFGFLSCLTEYKFVLKQKRSFTQLEQGDVTIVW